MRRNYSHFKKVTKNASGLGFDPETGCIVADDFWWYQRIQESTDASKLKTLRDIPLLEDLFDGRQVAIGDEGWNPIMTPHPPGDSSQSESPTGGRQDEHVGQQGESGGIGTGEAVRRTVEDTGTSRRPPSVTRPARKRGRTSGTSSRRTQVEDSMDQLSNVMRSLSQKVSETYEERLARKDPSHYRICHKLFQEIPGVKKGSQFWWAGVRWLMNPNHRDAFVAMEDNELRIQLIELETGVQCDRNID